MIHLNSVFPILSAAGGIEEYLYDEWAYWVLWKFEYQETI